MSTIAVICCHSSDWIPLANVRNDDWPVAYACPFDILFWDKQKNGSAPTPLVLLISFLFNGAVR